MTRVAACQVPEVRGDVRRSLHWIERFGAQATDDGVRLLVLPEGFLQGYFTDVARAREHALDLGSAAFAAVLRAVAALSPMLVVGMLESAGDRLFNSAVVIERGELAGVYRKTHLIGSEGDVFDVGDRYPVFQVDDLRFGINICHDTNFPEAASAIADQGATLIACPANNMLRRATAERWKHLHDEVRLQRVRETGLWLASADVTGESEDRIGYGPTAVLHPEGRVVARVPLGATGMVVADVGRGASGLAAVRLFDESPARADLQPLSPDDILDGRG